MGISVNVHDLGGTPVAWVLHPRNGDGFDLNRLTEIARSEPDRYPLLATVDPYGNTHFNFIAAPRVVAELSLLAEVTGSSDASWYAAAVGSLIAAITAPHTPHHRQLTFVGD